MLKKLIKHDFHALSRSLLPLQIGILVAALIATACLAYNLNSLEGVANTPQVNAFQMFMSTFTMVVMVIVMVGIAASAIVNLLLIGKRFYNNCICDEGYLTFTLPTTATQQLWSKLITGTLWTLINLVVIILSMVIFVVLGTGSQTIFSEEFMKGLMEGIAELKNVFPGFNLGGFTVQMVIGVVLGAVYSMLEMYFVILMGSMLARKHKILAAVGLYFGVNMLVGIISSAISTAMTVNLFRDLSVAPSSASIMGFFNGTFYTGLAISLALAAAFFLLNRWALTKRLNLE